MAELGEGLSGYLDVQDATLRAPRLEAVSNIGIANTAPQHAFSVGSNLYVDTESSNVLTVDGNVVCEGVKVGLIEIIPSYDLAAVSNVGNVTQSTIQFSNATTGFVTTANIEVGTANLFVDTVNSRVGVGTKLPTKKLHVFGDGQTQYGGVIHASLENPGGAPYESNAFSMNLGGYGHSIRMDLNTLSLNAYGDVGRYGALKFVVGDGAASGSGQITAMTLRSGGNVGIGTTNPVGQLEVHGEGQATTTSFNQSGNLGGILTVKSSDGTAGSGGGIMFGAHQGYFAAIKGTLSDGADNTSGELRFCTRNPPSSSTMQVNMVIDRAGSVGIGTTTPLHALDVKRDITIGSSTTTHLQTHFNIGNETLVQGEALMGYSGRAGNIINAATYWKTSYPSNYGTGGYFGIAVNNDSSGGADPYGITDGELESQTHLVVRSNGNVGIGTTDPQGALHVAGNNDVSNTSKALGIHMGLLSSTYAHMEIVCSGSNSGWIDFKNANTSGNGDYEERIRGGDGNLVFHTNKDERMRINASGNVGIGHADPYSRLHIKQSANDSSGAITLERSNSGDRWYVFQNDGNDLYFDYNGTMKGYIHWNISGSRMNFTGQHRTFIKDVPFSQAGDLEGLIVSADQNKYIKMSDGVETGSNAITINESLPIVSLTTKVNDKKCFGVISASEDPEKRTEIHGNFESLLVKELGDTRVYINSVGEGAIWVTDINGPLESGDYITTSNVAGYGQKQDSEFLANYTVAKITMDCDFNPATQPVQIIRKELSNVNYWVNTTYENVTEEEYSNLTEENRRTITETVYTNEDGETFTEQNEQSTYTELEQTTYQKIAVEESKTEQEGYELEVRQELVNVLDEHGQLQWEDDPSGATEKAYKIRYLDADGNITDEANAVHKAAFVGCTYHCG